MEEEKRENKPNIEKVTLSDGVERDYIDTYEKLYWIVNERLKKHKEEYPDEEPIIDLSRLIIIFRQGKGYVHFYIGFMCEYIDGIINLFYKGDVVNNGNPITIRDEIQFEVKYKLNIESSILYETYFLNTRFFKDISLYKTKFMGRTSFAGSIFIGNTHFDQIDLSKKNNNEDAKILDELDGAFTLTKNVFKSNVYFNSDFLQDICLDESTFDKDVEIHVGTSEQKRDYYCRFSDLTFNGNVVIDGILDRYDSRIFPNIIVENCNFNKKLDICNFFVKEISLKECNFNGAVRMVFNKYNKDSKLDFSSATINSFFFIDFVCADKDKPSMLLGEISFSKSLITKDAFILIRSINNEESIKRAGTLDFSYANILGTVTVQDSKLDCIKLDKSTLIGDINIENVETEYDSRESIAKIKNEYFQRNDIVNLLFYKAKEMKYYSEHLDFKYKFITNIFHWFTKNWFYNTIGICFLPILLLLSLLPIKSLEKVREYTLLYLNRISNSFGMSWGQGVLFTCVTAWIFFVFINTWGMKSSPLFVWGWDRLDSFGDVWKYYLNMFYLLDFKEKFKDILTGESIKLNPFGETLFFVSKIFVSYGIYQTISAFRKYGK